MTLIPWINYTDRMTGKSHPSLPDTLNAALRSALSQGGVNPDSATPTFPSFSKTVNAGSSLFTGTKEARITAANALALSLGWNATYVPYLAWDGTAMLPYTASLVAFSNSVKMTAEGSNPAVFDVRAYGAAGNDLLDDTVAIQAAVNAAVAGAGQGVTNIGATVFFPPGLYVISSTITVGGTNTYLIGEGRASVIRANAVMTNMLLWQIVGVRGSRGGCRDVLFKGNAQASWCIKLDSWHGWDAQMCEANDMLAGFIDITSNQATYTEMVTVEHCDVRQGDVATSSTGFARVTSGSTGSCTEIVFRDCFCLNPTGATSWGIELDDVQRCTIDGFVCANNSANFSGAVLVRESNTAAGAPVDPGSHWINNVYLENNGAFSAILCEVRAEAAATRSLRNIKITQARCGPENRTALNIVNLSGVNGRVANVTFAFPRYQITQANNIVIGTNVVGTWLMIPGDNNALAAAVTDNGSRTRYNLIRQEAIGAGGTPSATTSGDVGEITRNTSDGNLFIDDVTGTFRILWGVRVLSPAALGLGNNNDYAGGDNSETIRVSANAGGSTITGIANGVLGAAGSGRRLRIVNVSANTLTISNQDAASVAGNRIITGTGANLTFAQDKACWLEYDNTTGRWRVLATS